jgi:iron complex transport system permease protein
MIQRVAYVKNNWWAYTALVAVLAIVCAAALLVGPVWVPPTEVLTSNIVQMRLARVVLAVVAGAGLSVAGAIFQAILRNPLADPYVLGISSGAGLGAALAIILGATVIGPWALPGASFVGALVTISMVYALARTAAGAVPIHTLLLSGVIVSAVLGSILMFLVSMAPSENLHSVVWWLLGNLQVLDWGLLRAVTTVVATGTVVSILLARDLNLLTLGEEPAAHLGLQVERAKKVFFVLASLMTGATVGACGLIGFVGLIVPHSVRLAVGADHRRLIPAAALAGATFLVLADAVARTAVAPLEIPIGVITALLGGPFFLVLLKRRKSACGR